ncbi:phosphoribosylanthranilate isomerase [Lutibacter maritimus]|uniref:N-(5'-phosphoribosyl)anthranilate isomerase n=1 Tax=Lutibacter maritimus TaxID=593133 RepID=A0A1I6R5T1_9FLAO|nr:phosphoribosylanthranilate isomerase [Lutibacter maritimus]SFS60045.1 phosphoribosylanthranilate isomerase [Lutibacter maritimus]
MKIKVCGMRESENLQSLIALEPDFIGFIFYDKSKRFVNDFPQVEIPLYIKKVGVFVNETTENILKTVSAYNLDYVQLHGDESPEFCLQLAKSQQVNNGFMESFQLGVIKAFSVDESFDFSKTVQFEQSCDYFIFDTKGKDYGGNGVKFNWEILKNYNGKTPFLLSGGISKIDSAEIVKIKHKAFAGVDINSGFELEPGLKNIDDIKEFKQNLL